jgi:hypothetical protein
MHHPMENLHPSLQMRLDPPLALTESLGRTCSFEMTELSSINKKFLPDYQKILISVIFLD